MLDEVVELLEGAFVEQQRDPLARRELALAVLALLSLGPAPLFGPADLVLERLEVLFHLQRGGCRAARIGGRRVAGHERHPQPPAPQLQPAVTVGAAALEEMENAESCLRTDSLWQAGQLTGSFQDCW